MKIPIVFTGVDINFVHHEQLFSLANGMFLTKSFANGMFNSCTKTVKQSEFGWGAHTPKE